MTYTPSANATLTANISAYVKENATAANYTPWDYNYGYRARKISGGALKFDSPSAATYWSVELEGVDILKSMTVNLSGAFLEKTEGNYTFIGMEGENWQNLLQNLGVNLVKMTLPMPPNVSCGGMTVEHCNDNGSTCNDVKNFTGSVSCNGSHVTRSIPITLGFSTYTIRGGGSVTQTETYSMRNGWNLISIPLSL
jgi:hypothetical protein